MSRTPATQTAALIAHMREDGMSYGAIAKRLRLTKSTVNSYVTGRTGCPTLRELARRRAESAKDPQGPGRDAR